MSKKPPVIPGSSNSASANNRAKYLVPGSPHEGTVDSAFGDLELTRTGTLGEGTAHHGGSSVGAQSTVVNPSVSAPTSLLRRGKSPLRGEGHSASKRALHVQIREEANEAFSPLATPQTPGSSRQPSAYENTLGSESNNDMPVGQRRLVRARSGTPADPTEALSPSLVVSAPSAPSNSTPTPEEALRGGRRAMSTPQSEDPAMSSTIPSPGQTEGYRHQSVPLSPTQLHIDISPREGLDGAGAMLDSDMESSLHSDKGDEYSPTNGMDESGDVGDESGRFFPTTPHTPGSSDGAARHEEEEADEIIEHAIKIRGFRLRYMFASSFLFGLFAFLTVFFVMEAAYINMITSSATLSLTQYGHLQTVASEAGFELAVERGHSAAILTAMGSLSIPSTVPPSQPWMMNASEHAATLSSMDTMVQGVLCHSDLVVGYYIVVSAAFEKLASGDIKDVTDPRLETEMCQVIIRNCAGRANESQIYNLPFGGIGNVTVQGANGGASVLTSSTSAKWICMNALENHAHSLFFAALDTGNGELEDTEVVYGTRSSVHRSVMVYVRHPLEAVQAQSLASPTMDGITFHNNVLVPNTVIHHMGWEEEEAARAAKELEKQRITHTRQGRTAGPRRQGNSSIEVNNGDLMLLTSSDFTTTLPENSGKEAEALAAFQDVCQGGHRHTTYIPMWNESAPWSETLAKLSSKDLYATEGYNRVPVEFQGCLMFCLIQEFDPVTGEGLPCQPSFDGKLSKGHMFTHLRIDLRRMAHGGLFTIIFAGACVVLLGLIVLNVYFHMSIAVPANFLHRKIVATLTGTKKPYSKTRARFLRLTRPFWVGDLKALVKTFTLMSAFYTETRKYMPEHMRRRQINKMRDEHWLAGLLEEEEQKQKDELAVQGGSATNSVTTGSPGPEGSPTAVELDHINLEETQNSRESMYATGSDGFPLGSTVNSTRNFSRNGSFAVEMDEMSPTLQGNEEARKEALTAKSRSLHGTFSPAQPGSPIDRGFDMRKESSYTLRRSTTDLGGLDDTPEMSMQHTVNSFDDTTENHFAPAVSFVMAKSTAPVPVSAAPTNGAPHHTRPPIRHAPKLRSTISHVEEASFLVISIDQVEEAYGLDFKGAERVHADLVGLCFGIIRTHGGEISSKRGSSFGVAWNAFERVRGHANRAVKCALDLTEVLTSVRKQGLRIGIAVHTGPLLCGALGDDKVEVDVVFGATVEFTHVIADLGMKLSWVKLLISERVKHLISNKYDCLTVDVINCGDMLRYKNYNMPLFDVRGVVDFSKKRQELSRLGAADANTMVVQDETTGAIKTLEAPRKKQASYAVQFNRAFTLYRNHEFGASLELLHKLVDEFGKDPYLEHFQQMSVILSGSPELQMQLPKPYARPYPTWPIYGNLKLALELNARDMGSSFHFDKSRNPTFTKVHLPADQVQVEARGGAAAGAGTGGAKKHYHDPDVTAKPTDTPPDNTSGLGTPDEGDFKREMTTSNFAADLEDAVREGQKTGNLVPDPSGDAFARENAGMDDNPNVNMLEDSLADLRATNPNGAVATENGGGSDDPQGGNGHTTEEGFTNTFHLGPAQVQNEATLPVKITTKRENVYIRSSNALGKGSYGCVYLGSEMHTGKFVALKFLPLPVRVEDVGSIMNEVNIMQQVKNSYVVDFYDFAIVGNRIVFVMECVVPGSLSTMLKNFEGGLSPVTTVNFMRDVLWGLKALHDQGIIHRDVKPQNVLINATGRCKLSDFGASAALGKMMNEATGTVVGTPLYLAPEAARGESTNKKSDIWSLGIMFLELITGKTPYTLSGDLQTNPMLFVYQLGAGVIQPIVPDDLSLVTAEFAQKCLAINPEERYDAEQLLSLPFFLVNPEDV